MQEVNIPKLHSIPLYYDKDKRVFMLLKAHKKFKTAKASLRSLRTLETNFQVM